MARPQLIPVKKLVCFDKKLFDAIAEWRSKQRPLPNVSEAIRKLVEIELKAKL